MRENPLHIQFVNRQNPKAELDILVLEHLLSRKYKDHSPFNLHLVEFYLIILITDGTGLHTIDFTDYACKQGTILTIRRNQIHKFHLNKDIKGKAILFTDEFLNSYLGQLEYKKTLQLFNELLGTPCIQLSKDEHHEILGLIERMDREYFELNDDQSSGILRSELHILIHKLFRIKSREHEVIFNKKYLNEFIRFQELVEDKITESARVSDYARMMGVSTKTLNNITQNITNQSAKEFLDEILIKQIKRLLINTQYTAKEITFLTGFKETSNFHKYFKKHMGVTPEQFRSLS